MAGTDPKNSRGPGQASDRENYDADEDPLVELARIVSEDAGFSTRMRDAQRARRAEQGRAPAEPRKAPEPFARREPPADRTPRPPAREPDVRRPETREPQQAADLEAELMQELETSFATRERAPEPVEARPVQAPEPAPVRRAPIRQPEFRAAEEEVEPQQFEQEAFEPEPQVFETAQQDFEPTPQDEFEQELRGSFEPDGRDLFEPEPLPQQGSGPGEDDPDDLLRSIERQLSQFDQRIREPIFPDEMADDGQGHEEDRAASSSEELHGALDPLAGPEAEPQVLHETGQPDEYRNVTPPSRSSEYRFRGPAVADRERAPRREVEPEDREAVPPAPPAPQQQRLEVPTSVADAAPKADKNTRVAPPPARPEPDFASEEQQPAPTQPVATQPGRDDGGRPAWASIGVRTPDLAGLEAELSRELEPAYRANDRKGMGEASEESALDDRMNELLAHEASRRETSRDDEARVAAAAVIAPGRKQPPPRPAPPRGGGGSRKGLMTAVAVLLVVGLGGAAAMYLRSMDQAPSGPPPVIAAPEGPVKIEPAAGATESAQETVGEAVYNRVAGRAPTTEENVVEGAEEPRELAIVVPQSEGAPSGGPVEAEGASPGTQLAEGSSEEEFGPRRVPTFVVRPNGTIVSTANAETPAESADIGADIGTAQTAEMEPKPVRTVTIDEPRTAGAPAPIVGASPAPQSTPPPPAEAPGGLASLEQQPAPAAPEPAPAQAAQPEPAQPEPAPEQQVAAVPPPAPAAAVPPTASSGYVVQMSSQTSEEAAQSTFASMQQRYGAILGGLQPNIQRADLGSKGVYYRVRVGPWAERSEATEVCEALQAAGADCYVTQ